MSSALDYQADEFLDLVNDNDEVIGRELRSKVYSSHFNNYRVINGFVINQKGQLWIPMRTAEKKIFPSCLDFSFGGHVESGETYEQAFRREVQEELNINIDNLAWNSIARLTPKNGVSSFMNIYEIYSDKIDNYNKEDFASYELLYPKDVLKKIKSGIKAKDDLSKVLTLIYSK